MAKPVYGLVAEFTRPEELVRAVHAVRQAGYRRLDAYSPFAVEGLSQALAMGRTGMSLVMLLGGIAGCVGGYYLQYYSAVLGYPVNVGGRPLNSWPAFVPVTFELTVLCSALAGVFGLLALCGLPLPYHPLFHIPQFARASQDRFFLCLEAIDPLFEIDRARELLLALGPVSVMEVPP